jgi:serine O-acetyltransferase
MEKAQLNKELPRLIDAVLSSVNSLESMRRLDRATLPSRENAQKTLDKLLNVVFPGYFGAQTLTKDNVRFQLGALCMEVADELYEHVRYCLRYRDRIDRPEEDQRCGHCDREAAKVVNRFIEQLPALRATLSQDVQAAFDADPAATSTDETIFCYPGIYAIAVQRLAHLLYQANVPLLPRVWTEIAHSSTGIDIHPGAQLGNRFFIDHGTGVVIGETTVIGNNVKIYQGVTLGALSPAHGQMLRGTKRHPTIENDVTLYAGCTILGGETVIGQGSTIGGNVFITQSVPNRHLVLAEPKMKLRDRRPKSERGDSSTDTPEDDDGMWMI